MLLGLSSGKVRFANATCWLEAFLTSLPGKKKRVRPVCVYISDEIKLRFHCRLREARASAVIGWLNRASERLENRSVCSVF